MSDRRRISYTARLRRGLDIQAGCGQLRRHPARGSGHNAQARVKPVYQTFEGWQESTAGARSWAQLPAQAVKYVRQIEELIAELQKLGELRQAEVLSEEEFDMLKAKLLLG